MEIKITGLGNHQNNFSPVIGVKMNDLLDRLKVILDQDEIENLVNETYHILSQCANPLILKEQEVTHLAVGYVQSGKTMSFTSLTALAADNEYRIVIFFAGTKTNLLSQTTKRLSKDLISDSSLENIYKIYENPNTTNVNEIRGKLRISSKPTILISVLKHPVHINELSAIFEDKKFKLELGNQCVMIIDDEADQASLNGFTFENSKNANQSSEWDKETDDKESSTYSSILKLRASISNHSYVQYTATPQGPLLISLLDLLSPKSHTVLTPGKKYTGGKLFFREFSDLVISIPDHDLYNTKTNKIKNIPESLKFALQVYILSVSLITYFWRKEKFLSMMIHPGQAKATNRLFHKWVKDLIEKWATIFNLDEFDFARENLFNDFENVYNLEAIKLYESNENVPKFDLIKPFIIDVINDTQLYLIISDKDAAKVVDWDSSSSHILIGADMLNRGYTVEKLAVTYMPRYSKSKSNADTIQQRCRFFGYKLNYLKSCRVYLPTESISEYAEYVDHEEEMRKWLIENDNIEEAQKQLILSEKLNPTRKNILPVNIIQHKMRGWHSMNALKSIESNKTLTENFLHSKDFKFWDLQYGTTDRNHKYTYVTIDEATDFLSKFKFGNYEDSARKSATIRYINYLSSDQSQQINNICFIQMAFASEYRERNYDSVTNKIDQLFSGRATNGNSVYPGDREIKFENTLCIQIHKVKLKCKNITKLLGKTIFTLAVYYPDNFASGYVSNFENIHDFENYEE
jgi:hypothetical protein